MIQSGEKCKLRSLSCIRRNISRGYTCRGAVVPHSPNCRMLVLFHSTGEHTSHVRCEAELKEVTQVFPCQAFNPFHLNPFASRWSLNGYTLSSSYISTLLKENCCGCCTLYDAMHIVYTKPNSGFQFSVRILEVHRLCSGALLGPDNAEPIYDMVRPQVLTPNFS